jgi:hypothetical protein
MIFVYRVNQLECGMKTTGLFLKASATILTLATASVSMGVEYTWDGGAGTANLLTANNWDTNAVPGTGDRMIWNGMTSGALNLTFNAAPRHIDSDFLTEKTD